MAIKSKTAAALTITNPGFESGSGSDIPGWTVTGTSESVSIKTGGLAFSGNKYLYLLNYDLEQVYWTSIESNFISCSANKNYALSFWKKSLYFPINAVNFEIKYYSGGNLIGSNLFSSVGAISVYTQEKITFSTPENTTQLKIAIINNNTSDYALYLDDFSIVEDVRLSTTELVEEFGNGANYAAKLASFGSPGVNLSKLKVGGGFVANHWSNRFFISSTNSNIKFDSFYSTSRHYLGIIMVGTNNSESVTRYGYLASPSTGTIGSNRQLGLAYSSAEFRQITALYAANSASGHILTVAFSGNNTGNWWDKLIVNGVTFNRSNAINGANGSYDSTRNQSFWYFSNPTQVLFNASGLIYEFEVQLTWLTPPSLPNFTGGNNSDDYGLQEFVPYSVGSQNGTFSGTSPIRGVANYNWIATGFDGSVQSFSVQSGSFGGNRTLLGKYIYGLYLDINSNNIIFAVDGNNFGTWWNTITVTESNNTSYSLSRVNSVEIDGGVVPGDPIFTRWTWGSAQTRPNPSTFMPLNTSGKITMT